jgi:hypothetical protein
MPMQMIAGGGVLVAEVSEAAIAGVSVGAVEEESMVECLDGVDSKKVFGIGGDGFLSEVVT